MEIHYTKRIAYKMRFYAVQENPLRFAEKLTEPREGEFRFRVGDYRIIFDVVSNKIFVLKIKKRDEAYWLIFLIIPFII